MTINKDKIKSKIAEHKKTIKYIFETKIVPEKKMDWIMMKVKNQGKELVLVTNNFQCSKCKSKKNLQYHHTIMRGVKKILFFNEYLGMRNYYEHITLLCKDCHRELHHMNKEKYNHVNMGCIEVEFIKSVKEKYKG